MTILIIGLILFLGVHSVSIVNSTWRDRVAARIGENLWKSLYSLGAIAGFVLIVWGYGLARQDPLVLYVPPSWLRHVALLLMIFVFPLFLAPYLPGRISAAAKHPLLAAVKLWAFAHLLVNGSAADVVLFGSFLAWAVADRISFKRREPRFVSGAPASKWNDAIAVVAGLVIYATFVLGAHRWLFGIPAVSSLG